MPSLLIIGGVTIDRLHFAGRSAEAPGGAGLYTALAAARAGADVTLFAQRPGPLPALMKPIDMLVRWIGPVIPQEDLPRLEIAHHGGGRAELKRADWGAQLRLSPDSLPPDLSGFETAHIAALGPASRQLDFLLAVRENSDARISAGTYGQSAQRDTPQVLELARRVDYFFMNENECGFLYGQPADVQLRPGQVVFVTLGERGAWVLADTGRFHQPAEPADELDPTGAGDSFCGAVLAALANGSSLAEAGRLGVRLAAEVVRGVGPENLMPPKKGFSDAR